MTKHCPEESVVTLVADRLPAVFVQVMVLPATGLPPEVRAAVKVLPCPESNVKLDGEIERLVDGIGLTVPEELSLLDSYSLSPANDALTVTPVEALTVGAV